MIPSVKIVTGATLQLLSRAVNEQSLVGWRPTGQPFRDDDSNCWCWAMIAAPAATNGDEVVRLREPERKGRR